MKKAIPYRIGNIIRLLGSDPEIITEITSDSIRCKSGNGCALYSANHIPVTGAILLKSGFATVESTPGAYYLLMPEMTPDDVPMSQLLWINGSLFLQSWDNLKQMELWDRSTRGELALHNLQNIYFDLNGKDLLVEL